MGQTDRICWSPPELQGVLSMSQVFGVLFSCKDSRNSPDRMCESLCLLCSERLKDGQQSALCPLYESRKDHFNFNYSNQIPKDLGTLSE